jgi:hypothetical protein
MGRAGKAGASISQIKYLQEFFHRDSVVRGDSLENAGKGSGFDGPMGRE